MKAIIKLLFLLGILGGLYLYVWYRDFLSYTIQKTDIYTVEKWDTLPWFLQDLGFDTFYTKVFLKLHENKLPSPLQAGDYSLMAWDNFQSVLKTLWQWAITRDQSLTLLPGWNIYDIDEYLSQKWLINTWELIALAQNPKIFENDFEFVKGLQTLEWYLAPDTYFINESNFQLNDFIHKLLLNFKNKVYDPYLSVLTWEQRQEVMIFASIVEKEERNSQEKAKVAGILIKRYKNNWMIGADITACYAYKLTSEACKMSVSKYIYEKNDYNTRTMVWLPKTPIDNPSIETILATLNPEESSYWYYLHNVSTGKIYYGTTNAEHKANKKYLK